MSKRRARGAEPMDQSKSQLATGGGQTRNSSEQRVTFYLTLLPSLLSLSLSPLGPTPSSLPNVSFFVPIQRIFALPLNTLPLFSCRSDYCDFCIHSASQLHKETTDALALLPYAHNHTHILYSFFSLFLSLTLAHAHAHAHILTSILVTALTYHRSGRHSFPPTHQQQQRKKTKKATLLNRASPSSWPSHSSRMPRR